MINGASTKRLYESMKADDKTHGGARGAQAFCARLHEMLGITTDEFGRPALRDKLEDGTPRLRPEEFSIRDLAESVVGRDWVEQLDPRKSRAAMSDVSLLEAGAAIQPSGFLDISAFSTATGGLLQVKILEEYRKPIFIADEIMRAVPSKQRFEKMPATGRIGDKAEQMNPGQPHPRAEFTERYVTTPNTQKRGLAIDVTTEAVFFDLTNQMLMRAETVGYEIGLRKEKLCLDVVLGNTNPYIYNGTGYSTYLGSGNWINTQSNVLQDWSSFDACEQLFAAMTDQESGERIVVVPDTILVMPYNKRRADFVLNHTTVERATQSLAERGFGANPFSAAYKKLDSPIAYQRLTDSTAIGGGGISASNAKQYWFMFEAKRAFGYLENWALDVKRANANDYLMADQGLILSVFADEMGIPFVLEPRYVVQNTN